jgi:hypothetical protein
MEFFDGTGENLGSLRPDPMKGAAWEDAPGRPTTVGQDPFRAIPNPFLAGMAQGLLDWGLADTTPDAPGRETALSALLRLIDATLWSVDPYAHTGDEHLALLIGHPVAVLRAKLRLEINEPIHPEIVNLTRVPVRLGSLAQWQDGLYGFFINDDYRTFYAVDKSAAELAREVGPLRGFLQPVTETDNYFQTFADDLGVNVVDHSAPVDHPFVDTSSILHLVPNQEVMLTFLMEPHSVVHATTGYLPRKEIGMRREWVAKALARLSPTFRFGPVMVDPKRIRMPVPSEIHGTWSWDHRADLVRWQEDPVVNSTGDATLPADPCEAQEGWLRMVPPKDDTGQP